jgi:asparagine synthase (glutamine-hydrolysing)
MCGFIGRVNNYGPIFAKQYPLAAGLESLVRRGPDSIKEWCSEDGRVELLFARLAIVDTDSRAHQPLTDEQRGITIAFVGEIYNYLELKDKLLNYSFKSASDTEVLLALFALYGLEGFRWLRGMFALSIVDERSKRVYLIRDPIGKKPLFIARWQDNVLFGSSVLALAAVNKKEVRINSDILDYYWKNSFITPYSAAISGVTPVLPGQILELDWYGTLLREGRIEPEKLHIYNGEPLDEVKETVKLLLENSVKRRLINNPKPTVLLSGGIDSTLVCAILNKIYNKENTKNELQVISLKSFIPLLNDEFYARFAAWKIGIRLRLASPTTIRLGDTIVRALDLQDEPLGIISFFLLERLVNAASCYGKILLTGDGGDEVFLGYGKVADWYDGKILERKDKIQYRYGPEIPSWMSEWARKTVTDVLIGHMLTKVDRASAEQGVEIRCPLLDWDLVSYVRSLPFEILAHTGRNKALLKDQLVGWPHWFLERPKVGFAYNLRWHWGLSNYAGLRETINLRAIDTFERFMPEVLRNNPAKWKATGIFQNFDACWRLLAWSRFLVRLDRAYAG